MIMIVMGRFLKSDSKPRPLHQPQEATPLGTHRQLGVNLVTFYSSIRQIYFFHFPLHSVSQNVPMEDEIVALFLLVGGA